VRCDGSNDHGALGDGKPEARRARPNITIPMITSTQVCAGLLYACAVGSPLRCWGYNEFGQLGDQTTASTNAPTSAPGTWTTVSAGRLHTCAIDGTSALYCWGNNRAGQLGLGTFDEHHEPQRVGLDNDWKSVAAGTDHTCAMKNGGSVWCWGGNGRGQIGDGTAWRSALVTIR
jgi:alpha-tubulin suppressor-like RCC1 family protein